MTFKKLIKNTVSKMVMLVRYHTMTTGIKQNKHCQALFYCYWEHNCQKRTWSDDQNLSKRVKYT